MTCLFSGHPEFGPGRVPSVWWWVGCMAQSRPLHKQIWFIPAEKGTLQTNLTCFCKTGKGLAAADFCTITGDCEGLFHRNFSLPVVPPFFGCTCPPLSHFPIYPKVKLLTVNFLTFRAGIVIGVASNHGSSGSRCSPTRDWTGDCC